ncbi:hypothetical protein BT96DRAFT_948249 [Gymnopus androsaceus JB14]|uniref:Uncharacterized protein n=1 Tax=Gymnopus androsaceus JB14 TaxID=1447944 RepID=A0A6A4GQC6_9AGAR|nr:hypothetical protein BT96DRAFT_948249 [Gymnopus androsaceus JB14]
MANAVQVQYHDDRAVMRTSRRTQIEISFDQAGDSVTTSTATSDESHRTSVGSPPLVGNASIQWPMEIPRPSLIYKPPLYDGTEYHVIYTGSRVGIFGDWRDQVRPYIEGIKSHYKAFPTYEAALAAYTAAYNCEPGAPNLELRPTSVAGNMYTAAAALPNRLSIFPCRCSPTHIVALSAAFYQQHTGLVVHESKSKTKPHSNHSCFTQRHTMPAALIHLTFKTFFAASRFNDLGTWSLVASLTKT